MLSLSSFSFWTKVHHFSSHSCCYDHLKWNQPKWRTTGAKSDILNFYFLWKQFVCRHFEEVNNLKLTHLSIRLLTPGVLTWRGTDVPNYLLFHSSWLPTQDSLASSASKNFSPFQHKEIFINWWALDIWFLASRSHFKIIRHAQVDIV